MCLIHFKMFADQSAVVRKTNIPYSGATTNDTFHFGPNDGDNENPTSCIHTHRHKLFLMPWHKYSEFLDTDTFT